MFALLFLLASPAFAAPLDATQGDLAKRWPVPAYCSTQMGKDLVFTVDLILGKHTCISDETGTLEGTQRFCGPLSMTGNMTCEGAANNLRFMVERFKPEDDWRSTPPVSQALCLFNGMPTDPTISPLFWAAYDGDDSLPIGNAVNIDPGITFLCEEPKIL